MFTRTHPHTHTMWRAARALAACRGELFASAGGGGALVACAAESVAAFSGRTAAHLEAPARALHGSTPAAPWHPAAHEQRAWAPWGRSMQPGGPVRGMFIQTQPTPNPLSLMFLPGKPVMESGVQEFPNARAGMASPLAKRLFAIDGVTSVFFSTDYITVTKQEDVPWAALRPLVFAAIMDHYSSGEPLLTSSDAQAASDTAIHEEDSEVVAMIKELLETRIRPAVQEDGGDITFKGFDVDSGVVTVKMAGACSGCPSSTVTLKSGIENMLMHYIPEVKGVMEAPPDESENEGLKEFSRLESELGEGDQQEKKAENPMAKHLSH